VKVGMVGRGVMEAVGVFVGSNVCVAVGTGDGVAVAFSVAVIGAIVPEGEQAPRRKIKLQRIWQIDLFISHYRYRNGHTSSGL